MPMVRSSSKIAAFVGIYAAMYTVATYFLSPISFMLLNVRVQNILRGALYFYPAGVILGNLVAVAVANIGSPLGPLDLLSAPITSLGLYIAWRLGRKDPYVGFLIHYAILTVWLTILLGVTLGISYAILLPTLAVQLFISDYILPIALHIALKERGFEVRFNLT